MCSFDRISAVNFFFKYQLFKKLRLIILTFFTPNRFFFQFLRLTTHFLAVLRLTVNPIETLFWWTLSSLRLHM